MSKSEILKPWVLAAVRELGGEASVLEVAKEIWRSREDDLRNSGDIFYTWQYDIRWASQALRDEGKLVLSGKKWALK
jgi:hypothetical protein